VGASLTAYGVPFYYAQKKEACRQVQTSCSDGYNLHSGLLIMAMMKMKCAIEKTLCHVFFLLFGSKGKNFLQHLQAFAQKWCGK
jgi:hypothetical protein